MNEVQKLSLIVGGMISGIIIISLLFLVTFSTFLIDSDFQAIEEFSNNSDKVILIGSSYLTGINPIEIQNSINSDQKSVSVFNLLIKSDTPFDRKHSDLKNLINLEPKLVLYGIGIRDLDCTNNEKFKQTPLIPPNVEIDSPKQFSIKFLKFLSSKFLTQEIVNNGYYPSYIVPKDRVVNLEKQNFPINKELGSCMVTNNYQVESLIYNIKEFQKNEIKVVIFLVPHSQTYWENISKKSENSFMNTMRNTVEETKINLYDLSHEFENENIFSEPAHVANNPNVKIYSEKIKTIILQELD